MVAPARHVQPPLPLRSVLLGLCLGVGAAAVGAALTGALLAILWWHALVEGMAAGPVGCS